MLNLFFQLKAMDFIWNMAIAVLGIVFYIIYKLMGGEK